LQEQLERLSQDCSIPERVVEWINGLPSPLVLPRKEMEQVLRVAREALFNAKAHSQAAHIVLKLVQRDERVAVIVQDDGVGFDPHHLSHPDGRQHFGLSIMRARAARFDANLEIDSAPGRGTRVTLTWTPGVTPEGGLSVVNDEAPPLGVHGPSNDF
jgi:signal transduction histidine kinase